MRCRRGRRPVDVLVTGLITGVWLATATAAAAADGAVRISGFAFSPRTVTVAAGESVTWTNEDRAAHTATGSGGTFDTERLDPGTSTTIVFATAGAYPYVCAIHPTMTGTVVVRAADGGSGGTTLTPAPTDTGPSPPTPDRPDAWTLVIALLVVAGGALLGTTVALERRRVA